ncbi:PIN domain-containing protein [Saliphagus sp. LR7]|uniref:PIN domain-containing protein n=1 Tax=Saliphagus sp. LR7 TaxID=2282654 RepID=UPI000DF728B3|nr:PIN domain-containing protein [Saliphagus sp. LR7]
MILDSTLINTLARDDPAATDTLEELIDTGTPIAFSALTVFEVEVGLRGVAAQHRDRFENVVNRIDVVPLTRDVAHRAAAIQRELYDRGEPIGVVDVLIAATALERDEGVLTRNVDEFRRVDGLDVETY